MSSFLNFRSHKTLEGVFQWKNLPRTQFIWWFLFTLFPSSFPTRKKPSKSCNHLKYKPFTVPRNGIPHQNIDLRLFFLIDKKTLPTFIKNDNYIFFTALSFLRSIFQFGFFWNVYNRKRCTILFVVSFYLCWMLCIPCLYTYSRKFSVLSAYFIFRLLCVRWISSKNIKIWKLFICLSK